MSTLYEQIVKVADAITADNYKGASVKGQLLNLVRILLGREKAFSRREKLIEFVRKETDEEDDTLKEILEDEGVYTDLKEMFKRGKITKSSFRGYLIAINTVGQNINEHEGNLSLPDNFYTMLDELNANHSANQEKGQKRMPSEDQIDKLLEWTEEDFREEKTPVAKFNQYRDRALIITLIFTNIRTPTHLTWDKWKGDVLLGKSEKTKNVHSEVEYKIPELLQDYFTDMKNMRPNSEYIFSTSRKSRWSNISQTVQDITGEVLGEIFTPTEIRRRNVKTLIKEHGRGEAAKMSHHSVQAQKQYVDIPKELDLKPKLSKEDALEKMNEMLKQFPGLKAEIC